MSNTATSSAATTTTLTHHPFGSLPDGSPVDLYTLSDGLIEASVTAYGARLTSVKAPDRTGALAEVVLGHDSLQGFLDDRKTFAGAVVGRFGNRIAHGRFSLDGQTFQIPLNDGANALHGGPIGFDQKLWRAEPSADAVTFTLVSPDGDMGFPGTLTLSARYSLSAGTFRVDYTATTDQNTIVNVTNHAYFNLAGESENSEQPTPTILDHLLTIPATRYTPINESLIPTGELAHVADTPFDFTAPTLIGERIGEDNLQLQRARGYDHNWVFGEKGTLKLTARLEHPASGRVLTVHSTEPGMQFYSGNFLDGTVPTRDGASTVAFRSGLCLETQGYPDAPNQPGFPSVVLRAGETLHSTTLFTFSAEV
jgi:aldose 1-epimerase